jgi:carboxyl-terminal processing protease
MRRRFSLNALVVAIAAMSALVLTVTRRSPDGVVSYTIEPAPVRAAPGAKPSVKHDLSALKIFNLTLVRIKENYVDSKRIDPEKMLFQALDSVQFNIPEVLVEPFPDKDEVSVVVNDKRQTFETGDVDSPWRLARKLTKVFRFIEGNMNDGADLAQVEYAAVNGMLNTLDPHSVIMDPEAAREMDVSTSGKFGGLGIVIRMIERKLTVVRPMKGTPADKKGVKAGDHIVKIDSEPTENLTLNEAVDRMRGDPGTPVTLWIERKGVKGLTRFDLTRDVIRVESVIYKLLGKDVGYIKVKQFSSSTGKEVEDAMDELKGLGATAWVLDLRGNPGGLLEQAIEVSDLFVDAGTIVTTVSGRERDPRRAERGNGDIASPLAVLVNGGSASASEIVAGALKNLDRGIIIGSRTFGKGSVQVLYDNDDGSKLKLTVAEYLTPGDKSIQSLGIVPDIALQRMYVPDKNDAVGDWVRLLPPTRSWSEADYDTHLTSQYARDGDQPTYQLSYLYESPNKKKAAVVAPDKDGDADKDGDGVPEPTNAPPDPEEEAAADELLGNDEIVEDYEIRFARELVSSLTGKTRTELVKGAKSHVAKQRTEQDKKLADALTTLTVDWSAPPSSQADAPKLSATVELSSTTGVALTKVDAGSEVIVTGKVRNDGTGAAWRVHGRIVADDPVFEDTELVFGKIEPGATATFVTRLKLPKDAADRVDRLSFTFTEARGQAVTAPPVEVRVVAAPRPVFAYAYQLVDEGNGDGLLQKSERQRLRVTVRNAGEGDSTETTVVLRNASGDGVSLDRSRHEIGKLAPGENKTIEFDFDVTRELEGDAVVELMIWDNILGVTASEKLKFPVRKAQTLSAVTGTVEIRKATEVHEGPGDDTNLIGSAKKGSKFKVLGTVGAWTKIELEAGRPGFVPASRIGKIQKDTKPTGTIDPFWQVTPPTIEIKAPSYATSAATYSLDGKVVDETHVEDVYVYVSNPSAKIDGRKIFYKSNRGGSAEAQLDFTADVPLWPGSNQITIVAREKTEVRALTTLYVYREDEKTAQK